MIDREPHHGRGDTGRAAALVSAVAIVAIATGVLVAFGGGLGIATPLASRGTDQAASPGFTDLELVTVPPTGAGAGTSAPVLTAEPTSAEASARSSAAATPAAGVGIRANRILIARLGIDLAIVEGDGIDAPMGKAAHYPGSAWPDAGSNTYIYAHAQDGMFLNLWQAELGDIIELDLVDGSTRTYVVTQVLPKVPWDAVEYVEPTATEQLTLQTSTSYYSTAPRFIVIAVPRT